MITVKEEFLSSVKTQRAIKLGGYSVLAVWLALKAYVASGNTGGFVPAEVIGDLPGMPRRWEKPMQALIECGKLQPDGTRGPGLVDRVELGYQLHDYEDHGTPVEVEEIRRQKARAQKRARRLLLRHQSGDCDQACPHCVRGQGTGHGPDKSADTDRTSPRTGPRSRPDAGPPLRGGSQPIPAHPSPTDPDPTAAADPGSPSRARAHVGEQRQHRPRSFAEAIELPAAERARAVLANPHDGEYLEPQRWPEVEAVATALAEACKHRPPRLGSYQRDAGVRSVVGLLADGFSADELVRVARVLPSSEWWAKGRRGLASLTPEVVRRELDAAQAAPKLVDVTTDAVVARAERAAERAARAAGGADRG